jgi:hypothetical protein
VPSFDNLDGTRGNNELTKKSQEKSQERAWTPTRVLLFPLRLLLALIYVITTIIGRSILFTSWAYLLVYFVLSSTAARESVEAVVSQAIPGSLEVGAVQWGPWPGSLRVAEVRILDQDGAEVLDVSSVAIDVALGSSLTGLVQGLLAPGQPTTLKVDSVRVGEPSVNLSRASDGRLNLIAALSDGKDETSEGLPRGIDFTVEEVVLKGGSARVDIGAYQGETRGLDVIAKGGLTPDGVIYYQVIRGRIAHSDTQWPEGVNVAEGLPKSFAVKDIVFDRVTGTHRGIDIRDFSASPPDGSLGANGKITFGPGDTSWQGDVSLSLAESSPFLPVFSQSQADGALQLRAKSWGKKGKGHVEATLQSPEIWAFGFPMEDFELRATSVFGDGLDVTLESFSTRALGGHVLIESGQFSKRPESERFEFVAPLQLTDVDPFAIVGSTWVNLEPGVVPILEGWLQGGVRVSGHYDGVSKALDLEGTTEGLNMRWDGDPQIPLLSEYECAGRFRIKSGENTAPSGALSALKLSFSEFSLTSGRDRIGLSGDLYPSVLEIDTKLSINVQNLTRFLGHFGVQTLGGTARLKGLSVKGSLLNPTIKGPLSWTKAKIAGRTFGTISTDLRMQNGDLAFSNLKTPKGYGDLEAEGRIKLFDGSFTKVSEIFPFSLSKLSLDHIALERLWPSLGLSTDMGFKLTQEIRGTVKNALTSIRGAGRLQVNSFASAKHRIRKLSAEVRATKDALHLDKAKLTLCRRSSGGGCLAGGPSLAGAVTYKKRRGDLDSTVQLENFPLSSIKQFLPSFSFEGDVGATIRVEGQLDAPRVMGTAKVQGLKAGALYLGDASLELSWGEKPGDIIVHSSEFLDGLTLEESELKFRKGKLVSAALRAKSRRVALKRLFPGIQTNAFALSHTGNVEFSYKPGRVDPWRVHAFAPAGQVSIQLHQGKVRYKNTKAATVRVAAGRITIEPVAWKSKSGSVLDMCGQMDFDGLLNVEASGQLGMELVRPVRTLRDAFSRMEGGLEVQEPLTTSNNTCLPLSQKKVLRITGHRSLPIISGRLATKKIRLIPRSMGRTLRIDDGSSFTLEPGDIPGRQRILFPAKNGVGGSIDEGSFQVAGHIELIDFALHTVMLDLVGTDIFWASPGEYNVTFNPDLRLSATDFSDERMRRMILGGEVEITDGTYYKSFDQLAKVLGAVTGSQLEEFSQPITEKVPWLKSLVMDLGVRSTSHNLNVSSSFALGAADLDARIDLKIQGTLDKPQVFNRIDLAQGGSVTYDILSREFEVQHGYLDFNGDAAKPRIDIRAQAEIEYLESTGTEGEEVEEKSVTLTVNITGSLPDELEIELTGSPGGFDEGDLQSLLLTGKPISNSASARDDYQFNVPVGTYLKELLASPFVESVNVGLDSQGDWASEILTRLGRYASLQARAEGESGASTRLSARFKLHLSDSVILEGNVDRQTGTTTTTNEETYEARIKYRYVVD